MKRPRLLSWAHRIENTIALLSVLLLALFPFLEVIARKFFHTGISNSTIYVRHLVLIATFLAGAITAREKKHLSLSLILPHKERFQSGIHVFVAVLSAAVTFAFAWSSLSFALNAFDRTQKVGPVSLRLIVIIMFAGYILMGLRFISTWTRKHLRAFWVSAALIFGTVIAFDSVIQILRFFSNALP